MYMYVERDCIIKEGRFGSKRKGILLFKRINKCAHNVAITNC